MSVKPTCVFLDKLSLDCDDLNFSSINSTTDLSMFERSTTDEVVSRASHADIIITNKVRIDRLHFQQLPRLKLVCVIATGTNNIDFEAAAEHGVTVCNVKNYAAESVSQHVFMLMLALAGNFLTYQHDIKKGLWQKHDQFCLLTHPIQALAGKTLGLVGYGHIAKAVEKLALAFGMNIVISRSLSHKESAQNGRVPLVDLLQQADYISLHCPLTEYSENLFSSNEFAIMKSSAYIINTARGGIINEKDLLTALKTTQIAGAALDSLAHEPPLPDDPLITIDLPNLIITPHNAWGTHQARQKLVDGTAENIQNYINHKNHS